MGRIKLKRETPPPPPITHMKVVAFKLEDNVERWIEIWVSYGTYIDDKWQEWYDEDTKVKKEPLHFKIEDGCHPVVSSMSLRKCPTCGKWFSLEQICDVPECGGVATVPYDGYTRLMREHIPTLCAEGKSCLSRIKERITSFVVKESVPNAMTWEIEPLIFGDEEE